MAFSLDAACTDASIVRQGTSGDVFIRVKSATANTATASACTLTAKGIGMNPAKYRADSSLVEDQALTKTAKFTTVAKDAPNLPKVEKTALDGRELPLGEQVFINIDELKRYKVGDKGVGGTLPDDYCGGPNYPETRCTPFTLEGTNITTAHWRVNQGSGSTNQKVFWWTLESASGDGIVLLSTIENSANVLVQKKVFLYLNN